MGNGEDMVWEMKIVCGIQHDYVSGSSCHSLLNSKLSLFLKLQNLIVKISEKSPIKMRMVCELKLSII